MKKIKICSILSGGLLYKFRSHQSIVETGKIYPHIPLEKDTSLSYAIYIPKDKNKFGIYIFDPHGSGFAGAIISTACR